MRVLFICILLNLFITSCVKDKPQDVINGNITTSSANSVLVINEGGFGWANSSVSLYDPSSNAVVGDYYKQQNAGQPVGDVCQSITKFNNKYYLVVNNSNKVIVADGYNFTKTGVISGFNSPRYMLPITYNKAYVSDLYASSIKIVNLNTNTITGSIACMAGTEQMVLIYNIAFVTNPNSKYCYVINTINNTISDSINVGKNTSGLLIDKYDKVWILSKGDLASSQNPSLKKINPISLVIEQNFTFMAGDSPWRLCANKTLDTLYYLNKGVCKFPITDATLPTGKVITEGSKLYYGLGINQKNYTIYVADAIDYVQKSKIEIYTSNGSFINSFNAGIISNGFVFE